MDKGFEKINFAQENDSITPQAENYSMRRRRKSKSKFRLNLKTRRGKIITGVLAFLLLFLLITGVQGFRVYQQAQVTNTQARVTLDHLRNQNIVAANQELATTKQNVEELKNRTDQMFYLRVVPGVHWYYNDARHSINAAVHGVNAVRIATEALEPHADILGLGGDGGSFTAGSAEDRIRLTVQALDKIVPQIDDIDQEIQQAEAELSEVDAGHYPNFWKFKNVRDQITSAQNLATNGTSFMRDGKPLIKLLPQLLGGGEEKKYLILFQNDKELRPTGGFITFYSVFRVEEGVLTVDESSDIYDLDESITGRPDTPYIINEFLPEVGQWYIRDTNLSPDFKVSMEDFMDQYQNSSAPQDIDGIIALDTHFFVNALEILGEVEAGGFTFNTDNDPRCDCPQAVYILEDQTTRPVGFVRENRKSLLADLMQALMQKTLASAPGTYWGPLFQQALKDSQEKHILFYLFDEDAQKGIEALGWGGRIKEYDGDYMHINDANFGGAKSNLYVEKSVLVEYTTRDDGEIDKKVTITYKNPHPHSDCNLERGGLCLNAVLRNFQRMYVPQGSVLNDAVGSSITVEGKEDLGKTYFESYFRVSPQGRAEMMYEYTLPFKLETDSTLPLLIQKQPGVESVPYEIQINGEKVEEFELITDRDLNLEVF